MDRTRTRLGILLSHPVQYLSPWFRELAGILDLKVFYVHAQSSRAQAAAGYGVEFEWDVPLLSGYEYEWLSNEARRPGVEGFFDCDVPGIEGVVERANLDALLVFGWRHKSCWQAYRACRRQNVPILMKGDASLRTPRSVVRRVLKWMPYRLLIPRFDAHLYIGSANKAYLKHYGVPDNRLFFSPLSIDQKWFSERSARAHMAGEAARVRSELGIDAHAFVFLFVGRLIETKRPEDFVRGFMRLRREHGRHEFAALVVGDGPLRDEMQRICRDAGCSVHFAGFRNQTELPAFYRAADALVLPGNDSWGLVVNEAGACGIPAVVSDCVGCGPDLIDAPRTGFVFEKGNIADLARCLYALYQQIAAAPGDVARALLEKQEEFGQQAATKGLLEALEVVVQRTDRDHPGRSEYGAKGVGMSDGRSCQG